MELADLVFEEIVEEVILGLIRNWNNAQKNYFYILFYFKFFVHI